MNKCDDKLVQKIIDSSDIRDIGGLSVDIKAIPDDDTPGVLDRREYLIRSAIYAFQKMAPVKFSVEGMRAATKTSCIDACKAGILVDKFTLETDGFSFDVYRYERKDSFNVVKPAMIYVHGGSFMASNAAYYEMPCKYTAELLDCIVFNIDYSLAPECRYPGAIKECCKLLEYIYENAEELSVDKNKIGMFGDSAGANLVLATVLDNKSEANVSYCGLFYPVVDLYSRDKLYDWEEDMYEISDEQRELILSRIQLGRSDGKGSNDLMAAILYTYVGDSYEDVKCNPDVSPVYADLSVMPPTGIFSAEYDGLRIQGEYYAKLLEQSGIPVKLTRYRGVTHAFLDYFGILPQGEAAIYEMCSQIKKVWGIDN